MIKDQVKLFKFRVTVNLHLTGTVFIYLDGCTVLIVICIELGLSLLFYVQTIIYHKHPL